MVKILFAGGMMIGFTGPGNFSVVHGQGRSCEEVFEVRGSGLVF